MKKLIFLFLVLMLSINLFAKEQNTYATIYETLENNINVEVKCYKNENPSLFTLDNGTIWYRDQGDSIKIPLSLVKFLIGKKYNSFLTNYEIFTCYSSSLCPHIRLYCKKMKNTMEVFFDYDHYINSNFSQEDYENYTNKKTIELFLWLRSYWEECFIEIANLF